MKLCWKKDHDKKIIKNFKKILCKVKWIVKYNKFLLCKIKWKVTPPVEFV